MPNVNAPNGPERLLPLLTDGPQSGNRLGEALGVGRVTVHTWAAALQEQGVPLRVSRRGYALESGTPAPGLVVPQGEFGRSLRYLGEVGSTQDELRRWDDAGRLPNGAVVVAERQTAGRGRRGRVWLSATGNLTFSVLLRGPLPLGALPLLPLRAGVALRRAAGVGGLKWPNDLLLHGRKLAGVLLEAELRGEEAARAVLGIGINVAAAPPGAACVADTGPAPPRAALLAAILRELENTLNEPPGDVLAAWRAHNVTLGQRVRFGDPPREGLALDLDDQGGLQVRCGEHTVTAGAGDVELIGSLPPAPPHPHKENP